LEIDRPKTLKLKGLDAVTNRSGVIFQSVPRSGTSFLLDHINATGKYGRGGEWLNKDKRDALSKSMSAEDHFEFVLRNASVKNGRFLVKIFPDQLVEARRSHGYDFIELSRKRFDVGHIRLKRRDKVLQAISYYRALETREWASDYDPVASHPHYDFKQILTLYRRCLAAETFWDIYNDSNGITPVEFEYEAILDRPEVVVSAVADLFSESYKHLKDRTLVRNLKIQRDDLTLDWAERFRAELDFDEIHETSRWWKKYDRKSLKQRIRKAFTP